MWTVWDESAWSRVLWDVTGAQKISVSCRKIREGFGGSVGGNASETEEYRKVIRKILTR